MRDVSSPAGAHANSTLGARVSATASARDAAFVAGLGADRVIDYARPPIDGEVHDVDIVVDTVGGEAMAQCWRVLRPGGILVGIASAPLPSDERRFRARGVYFVVEPDREGLTELARLADAGKLGTTGGRVFPLADATAAFDALQHEHTQGKIVLTVRPEPSWTDER